VFDRGHGVEKQVIHGRFTLQEAGVTEGDVLHIAITEHKQRVELPSPESAAASFQKPAFARTVSSLQQPTLSGGLGMSLRQSGSSMPRHRKSRQHQRLEALDERSSTASAPSATVSTGHVVVDVGVNSSAAASYLSYDHSDENEASEKEEKEEKEE